MRELALREVYTALRRDGHNHFGALGRVIALAETDPLLAVQVAEETQVELVAEPEFRLHLDEPSFLDRFRKN